MSDNSYHRASIAADNIELRKLKAIWRQMHVRCRDRASYRKLGVTVCARWRESFLAFLYDMGPRPTPRHSIERKNNKGSYTPSNCKWATRREQGANKSNNRRLTCDGRTMHAAEWARKLRITRGAFQHRLNNWPLRRALTEPRRSW